MSAHHTLTRGFGGPAGAEGVMSLPNIAAYAERHRESPRHPGSRGHSPRMKWTWSAKNGLTGRWTRP